MRTDSGPCTGRGCDHVSHNPRLADEDLTTPEQLLHRGEHRSRNHALTEAWLRPVRGPYQRALRTVDKPVGDMTVPEVFDWALVLGYAGVTGYAIGKMAGNLLEVLLGGRRR